MGMDYSMITMHNNELLPPSTFRRYILVLRGSGIVQIDNRTFKLSLHDALVIPPKTNALFQIESNASKQPLLLGSIKKSEPDITAYNVSLIPAQNTDLIRRIFYLALDIQDITDPFYDSVNTAIDQLMFTALIATDMKTYTMNPQVYMVITDINEHFTDVTYTVKDAIERTGYSTNHFRKLFREEVGMTPTDFITRRRMDRATDLFHQFKDRIPIKEIAWQCGYQDPYYFSRQFKKNFNMSPQQYVEQL